MNANVETAPSEISAPPDGDLELISTALVEFDRVSAGLAQLEKVYKGVLYDCSTELGLEHAKAARNAISEPRIRVEKIRKKAKAPILSLGRKLDARAEKITEALLALETPIQMQLDEHKRQIEAEEQRKRDAELMRIGKIKRRINDLHGDLSLTASSGSMVIAQMMSNIDAVAIDDSFQEFKDEALAVKTDTRERLTALRNAALAHEDAQRRLAEERAQLAAEKASRDAEAAAQAEARARQEGEDKARRDAEEKRIAEARAAQVAEARAHAQRIAAEKAENDRLAEEQRQANAAEAARIVAAREALEREQAALAEERRNATEPQAPEPKAESFTEMFGCTPVAGDPINLPVSTAGAREPPADPESFKLAEYFLAGIKVATDWHKKSLAQAIQMSVEDWFKDFEQEDPHADGAEEDRGG